MQMRFVGTVIGLALASSVAMAGNIGPALVFHPEGSVTISGDTHYDNFQPRITFKSTGGVGFTTATNPQGSNGVYNFQFSLDLVALRAADDYALNRGMRGYQGLGVDLNSAFTFHLGGGGHANFFLGPAIDLGVGRLTRRVTLFNPDFETRADKTQEMIAVAIGVGPTAMINITLPRSTTLNVTLGYRWDFSVVNVSNQVLRAADRYAYQTDKAGGWGSGGRAYASVAVLF